ncbi:MAG TPA: hypothetical protein VH116_09440 [Gemmatimonadales bacterium]|jgi:hypothetical protein|nr:hypothetical protein [Gemmatimonadales bacterium]
MASVTLSEAIQKVREQAKSILTALEQTGHPQTEESSSLYLALVTIQKQVKDQGVARFGEVAKELEQLGGMCKGKLEALKPLLDDAVRLARPPKA